MLVYVVRYGIYTGDESGIIGIYNSLSKANIAMDKYNDSSMPDHYAVVDEYTIID